jgi:hypothetical protein
MDTQFDNKYYNDLHKRTYVLSERNELLEKENNKILLLLEKITNMEKENNNEIMKLLLENNSLKLSIDKNKDLIMKECFVMYILSYLLLFFMYGIF